MSVLGPAPLLLSKRDLALRLGKSPSTIERLERCGVLPQRRRLGGSAVWLAAEVEAALVSLPSGANSARTEAARSATKKAA